MAKINKNFQINQNSPVLLPRRWLNIDSAGTYY